MSQPSDPSEKLKKLLNAHYSSEPPPILPGIALAADDTLMMCMDCGKRQMTPAESREHHCPPGKCHVIGCDDPRHIEPVAPSPPTENARDGAEEAEAKCLEIATEVATEDWDTWGCPDSLDWVVGCALVAAKRAYSAGRARGIEEERAKQAKHVCSCSNMPCPKCGGYGPSGEWHEGDEVTCDDCGAALYVTDVSPCTGTSYFEVIPPKCVDCGEDVAKEGERCAECLSEMVDETGKAIADAIAKETEHG